MHYNDDTTVPMYEVAMENATKYQCMSSMFCNVQWHYKHCSMWRHWEGQWQKLWCIQAMVGDIRKISMCETSLWCSNECHHKWSDLQHNNEQCPKMSSLVILKQLWHIVISMMPQCTYVWLHNDIQWMISQVKSQKFWCMISSYPHLWFFLALLVTNNNLFVIRKFHKPETNISLHIMCQKFMGTATYTS